jgi:hypothetical protein
MVQTPQMLEYELVLQAITDRAVTLDIRVPGSTGSSHVAEFSSSLGLRDFLTCSGLGEDKVQEIETMAHGLRKGDAFYAKSFLPTSVEESFKNLIQGRAAAA